MSRFISLPEGARRYFLEVPHGHGDAQVITEEISKKDLLELAGA